MDNTTAPEAPEIRCPICDDVFSRPYCLKRHMVRIHGYTYDEYITHISSNITQNSSSITQSSSNTTQSSSNITHNSSTIHNNSHQNNDIITDKEYKCTKCFKCFNRNWSLQRHLIGCKGIKDCLSCEYCHTLFSHVKSRFKHYKVCLAKKEIDSKALIPFQDKKEITTQVASTIKNIHGYNIDTQNNIQNQQNNNNIIVVYNSSGTDFKKEHINQEAFIKKILQMVQPHIDRSFVLDYGRELFNNPQNQCIKKDDLKSGHSEVHIGDNRWELKLDRTLYPKLVNDIANNLSEIVYTNRSKIPKQWFERIIGFLDYMAEDGYINSEDREKKKRIEQDFKLLAKELKLIIYEVTKQATIEE